MADAGGVRFPDGGRGHGLGDRHQCDLPGIAVRARAGGAHFLVNLFDRGSNGQGPPLSNPAPSRIIAREDRLVKASIPAIRGQVLRRAHRPDSRLPR